MKARAQRIFPLYWILTILALIVFILKPSLVNSSGGETSLFSSFTLIPTGEKLLINNGWTLSFEFLFYLVFAFSIQISSKYKSLSSIILLNMTFIGVALNIKNPQLAFITSPLLLEFMLGILAYKIITDIKVNKNISYLLILFSIFFLGLLNYYGPIENIFGRSLYAGIPMFLLFVGFVSLVGMLNNKNKLFYGIGMSSYSLYLVHPFALSGVTLLFKRTGMIDYAFLYAFLYALSMISIACVVGWMCFCFIEKPIAAFISTRKKLKSLDKVSLNT